MPPWLPDLVRLEDYNGDWGLYLEALYAKYQESFAGAAQFRGKRLGVKRHPVENGKDATFWHFISEGKIEAERVPDIRRCERILWPRAIIDNCDDACLSVWNEEVGSDLRVHIWCEEASYLLVVADRGEYALPWTGYPVTYEHQRVKLRGRFERYK